MRFMMLVKANKDSEAGVLPSRELIAAMGKFNEEMMKAGVLLAGEGLHASPFTESQDLIAGFWLIQVKSKEEAVEWARRCPPPHDNGEGEIEIRQVFEASDFPAENPARVQRARGGNAQRDPGEGPEAVDHRLKRLPKKGKNRLAADERSAAGPQPN